MESETEASVIVADGGGVEATTGNPISPGGSPEDVSDDIPAQLSDGEMIISADVVRFLGVEKLEALVKKAKKGLAEMDAEGRVNGRTPEVNLDVELEEESEEDFPFSIEDLEVDDDGPVMMDQGGLVLADGEPEEVEVTQPIIEETPQVEPPKPEEKPKIRLPSFSVDRSMYDMSESELGEYVKGQQSSVGLLDTLGQAAGAYAAMKGGAGGMIGGMLLAGLAKSRGNLQPLAVTRAAAQVALEKGYDGLAGRLKEQASKIDGGLKPVTKLLQNYMMTGDGLLESHRRASGGAPTAPKTTSATPPPAMPKALTSEAPTASPVALPVQRGIPRPTPSINPRAPLTMGTPVTADETTTTAGGLSVGFSRGGLVRRK